MPEALALRRGEQSLPCLSSGLERVALARPADIVGVARSAFRSATERLHRDRASYVANPGPGTYSAGPKWGKDSPNRGTSGRSVASSVAFTRRPACPSMPDKFHSYGYDEGPDGTLVAQRPENIRTGVGTDVPGPTDYDPDKKATTRSELATSFAKVRLYVSEFM